MRRLGIGVVLGALGAAVVLACSSFSGDSPAPPVDDAGPETGSQDTGSTDTGTDAGIVLGATPGTTECPGSSGTCSTVDGLCCYDYDSGVGSCGKTCILFAQAYIHCDDKADCSPGMVCCLGLGETHCVTPDQCDTNQLCRTNEECPPNEGCGPVDCVGRTMGACGAITKGLSDFCTRDH